MSDEYTPTVEYARAQYARQENYDYYYEGDLYLTPDGQLSASEFDRMIAEVERAAAVKALREAAFTGYFGTSAQSTLLRLAERREADRIEKGEG
jgi:hypothetical protein